MALLVIASFVGCADKEAIANKEPFVIIENYDGEMLTLNHKPTRVAYMVLGLDEILTIKSYRGICYGTG